VSGSLCGWTLVSQGADPVIAIAATLVALYAPQTAYNAARSLHLQVNGEAADG